MQTIRQGDVLVIECDNLPKTAKVDGDQAVMAHGEVTGHKHQFTGFDRERVQHFVCEKTQRRYLQILGDEPVTLKHEEHGPATIPPGIHEIRIQREYEPNGWRNVAD